MRGDLKNVRALVDVVALLHKQPRTAPELAALTGSKAATVRGWIMVLEEEALIETAGVRAHATCGTARQAVVWQWKR